jgi:hypothetical protein
VTPEAWEAIVKKAIDQATRGSARAREWLARYLLPESCQRVDAAVEHRGIDVQAILQQAERRPRIMNDAAILEQLGIPTPQVDGPESNG